MNKSNNLHTTATPQSSRTQPRFSPESIKKAERVLIDNGIDPDEAETVLQAVGYALLNEVLYPH